MAGDSVCPNRLALGGVEAKGEMGVPNVAVEAGVRPEGTALDGTVRPTVAGVGPSDCMAEKEFQ